MAYAQCIHAVHVTDLRVNDVVWIKKKKYQFLKKELCIMLQPIQI